MKTQTEPFARDTRFHDRFVQGFKILKKAKASKDQEVFNRTLLNLLPEVKRYLIRGLRLALSKGVLPHNKYRPEDFFDALFIEVYDHLDHFKDAAAFRVWLFESVDALLRNMELEELSDTFRLEDLDAFVKAEQSEMDESFTTDGDGDRIMMDELDDISYSNHEVLLRNIFLDDDQEVLMSKMVGNNFQPEVSEHLENVLFELPAPERSVFELAIEQGFDLKEIARIKDLPLDKVNLLLQNARNQLYEILSTRLFNT